MESRAIAIFGDVVEGDQGMSLSFQSSGALQLIRKPRFDGNLIFGRDVK